MHDLPDIRRHFTPFQPTVRKSSSGVVYTEVLPHVQLSRYIYCYWELRTTHPLKTPFYYKVVADACTDIFFDAKYPRDMQVMGFTTAYTEFSLGQQFHYTGIRFLPAVFPLLFQVRGQELTERVEGLDAVLPQIFRGLLQCVSGEETFLQRKEILDRYFLRMLNNNNLRIDHRFFNALDIILKRQGALHVQSDLDTGISPRQLRRLFEFYVGSTPKTFSKVVRFQHILNARPSVQSLKENKLFFDAGYYDQSHFIKEFKTMYGVTPTIALRSGQ